MISYGIVDVVAIDMSIGEFAVTFLTVMRTQLKARSTLSRGVLSLQNKTFTVVKFALSKLVLFINIESSYWL